MPVGVTGAPDGVALAWLPVVGIAIGALTGAFAWGVSTVAPHALVVAAAFAGTIVLSGAVHVDGFLDTFDALSASVAPERRLEIMKDPRHGTFAVAGFAVAIAWWIAALSAIDPARLPFALAFAGGSARFAAVQNVFVFPYGRANGSAAAFAQRPPPVVLVICACALAAIAFAARAPAWIAVATFACAIALLSGRSAARRLGGVLVGDVYGAMIVALEIVALTAIVVVQGH